MRFLDPVEVVWYTIHTKTIGSGKVKKIIGSKYHYAKENGDIISTYGGKERVLKGWVNSEGYIHYDVINNSEKGHRLIAQTFLPNPNNYPQVNHINGNKADNRVENLEWCDNAHNQQHAWDTGLQQKRTPPNAVLTQLQADEIRKEYLSDKLSQRALAKKYNVSKTTIADILKGKYYNLDGLHESITREKTKRKLSFSDAQTIRAMYKTGDYSYNKLGILYAVDHKTIKRITDNLSYTTPEVL